MSNLRQIGAVDADCTSTTRTAFFPLQPLRRGWVRMHASPVHLSQIRCEPETFSNRLSINGRFGNRIWHRSATASTTTCMRLAADKWQHAESVRPRLRQFLWHLITPEILASALHGLALPTDASPNLRSRAEAGETTGTHRSGTQDQCAILAICTQKPMTFGPASTTGDISKTTHQLPLGHETLGPNEVTERVSHDLCGCRCRTHPNRQAVVAANR